MNRSFVLRGDLCHSLAPDRLEVLEDGFLVCQEGRSAGLFSHLPSEYADLPLLDFSGLLVVPGLVDLHVHAPQYPFRGLGMDLELLDWLDTHTFPEESRYADPDYASAAYLRFVEEVRRGPNTRACVFATCHTEATVLLMDLLEASGLSARVGRVNMDRNAPPSLCEPGPEASLDETRRWLAAVEGRYQHISPILTPRFIPSCSDELLEGLHAIQQETGLPVQSHLSENPGECAWVRELCPWSRFYGDAYRHFGLFGGADCPTIMAHCVYSGPEELELMKAQGVWVAHCPASNTNLSSGIAPIRRYLTHGLQVGLGSDVAGGTQTSIFRAMADAIQVSKLRWRLVDQTEPPLTAAEAFYLGTLGGGSFFGRVGSFAPGYELDALVIRDSRYSSAGADLPARLEQTIYLSDERDILHKFVSGRCLF